MNFDKRLVTTTYTDLQKFILGESEAESHTTVQIYIYYNERTWEDGTETPDLLSPFRVTCSCKHSSNSRIQQ